MLRSKKKQRFFLILLFVLLAVAIVNLRFQNSFQQLALR